jgi:hypothetical protein
MELHSGNIKFLTCPIYGIEIDNSFIPIHFEPMAHSTTNLHERTKTVPPCFALGILLIELEDEKSIVDIVNCQYGPYGKSEASTAESLMTFKASLVKYVNTMDRCTNRYRAVISACLNGPWDSETDNNFLDDEMIRERYCESVIVPLTSERDWVVNGMAEAK